MKNLLLQKIQNKLLKVGVIGLGYVGLPLAVEKAVAGYKVVGFDVQSQKVDMINQGINYIGDVVDEDLKSIVKSGKLMATNDFSFIKDMDFIAICVPTPLDQYQQPDITYVKKCALEISKYLKRESVVVLESTTYPGTTEELLLPILEEGSGLKSGEDFYLGFSPERVDPGNSVYKTKNTPKVVGGVGKDATEVIAAMYRAVLKSDVMEVSSPKIAEMEKLLENIYRHINIGLANEMAIICDKMGINVWEVIDAAKTKPYGFQAFYPGPGVGGHCIPLDPYYLVWKAKEYNYHAKLIETSGIINDSMPEYIVERCYRILNRYKKPMNGSKVLLMGVAYKQDIDDYRESPAVKVFENLEKEGAVVSYYDNHITNCKIGNKQRTSIKNLLGVSNYDLIVIATAHSNVDYKCLTLYGVPIFDTKNVMKNVEIRANIEVL